ncbi:MAG: DUF6444 domain-containing protein [Acidimicrobiales bacterium]
MADDGGEGAVSPSFEELRAENARLQAVIVEMEVRHSEVVRAQAEMIDRLEAKVADLERRLGQTSGNSSLPSSRDPAGRRQRQARQRAERLDRTGGPERRRGKQAGAKGKGLEMSPDPELIVDNKPEVCES